MQVPPIKNFIELIQKSGLVQMDQLREALVECREENGGRPLTETEMVSDFLIDKGLLTQWQLNKLYVGKHKGFFLGKYKLHRHLGTGGMSSVYLAEHTLMKQLRAIKVLPKKRVDDKTYFDRFYLEARATAALDHKNIVRAHDIDNDSDTHYIVMEYIDGLDFSEIVKQEGPPAFHESVELLLQAACGLQFAHDSGVIHRDVKPGNLLRDKNRVVKILDMGLALFHEDDESLTIANNEKVLGTADYLAPEQAINSHEVDHRADIYGLGGTFYFLLTGHAPFPDGSLAQRIAMHQTKMPTDIRKSRADCPKDLASICMRMLQKDPNARYQSCNELITVLQKWLVKHGYAVKAVSSHSTAGGRQDAQAVTVSQSNVSKSQREVATQTIENGAGQDVGRPGSGLGRGSKKGEGDSQNPRLPGKSFSKTDPVRGSQVDTFATMSGLKRAQTNTAQGETPDLTSLDAGETELTEMDLLAESGSLSGLDLGSIPLGQPTQISAPIASQNLSSQQSKAGHVMVPKWLMWLSIAGVSILLITLILVVYLLIS